MRTAPARVLSRSSPYTKIMYCVAVAVQDYPLRFFDGADTAGGRDRQVAYQEAVAPHRCGAHTDNPSVVSGTPEQPRVSLQESRSVIPEKSHPAAVEAYQRLFTLAQQTRCVHHLVWDGPSCTVQLLQ